MSQRPSVLIVAPAGGVTRSFVSSLRAAGYTPKVVEDFASGKEALTARPDLLITELKLGAYNGLHLAIRASVQGTTTIVVGDPDPVLEEEARRQHATYLTQPLDHERLLKEIDQLLAAALQTRRSPRKQVPQLAAFVNDVPARLLDVSYEGMRLEAGDAASGALPRHFKVRLPLFNFSCDVQRVWTSPLASEGVAAGGVFCGAALSGSDTDTAMAWRTLVDSLPGLAVTA